MPQFNEGNINSYLVPSGSLTGSLSNSGTLTGQIAIGSGGGTSDYNDLTNKPQINSVTLSGNKTTADLNISYNDLDDKPTIPADLNDLSDVNINNPYQTDVLSYNESTSKWINHPVSLTVEGLSNVALSTPYVGEVLKISSTSSSGPVWRSSTVNYSEINNTPTLATVATSGDYDDLTNKPTIPAAQVNSDWNAASGVAEILNKPSLATVATSGDYDDLINTPVPSYENKGEISDLNNVALDDGGAYKYIYNSAASNRPGTGGGTMLHMWNSGNHAWGCQVAFSDRGMYFRGVINGTFGAWNTIVSV